jgi:hypothetical protein
VGKSEPSYGAGRNVKWYSHFGKTVWLKRNENIYPYKNVYTLFRGTSWAGSCTKMKLNISFLATGCHKLIEVAISANSVLSMRSRWPPMLLLTLWVKNGRAMWSSSVMGRTNNVFP